MEPRHPIIRIGELDVTEHVREISISTAGDATTGWRQRECGCWERWIEGSNGIAEFAGWAVLEPCPAHADR